MTAWVDGADDNRFGIEHLPYGAVTTKEGSPRVVVRIGHSVLDLSVATVATEFDGLFNEGTLDAFLAAGRRTWRAVRAQLVDWFTDPEYQDMIEPLLSPAADARLRMPFSVADYVDFYASEEHATNVGRILRPDSDPLPANWKHLPIAYHGRAGTVVVSGTPVCRPSGQARQPDGSITFGPTQRLDFEAEVAFVVGVGTALGTAVPVNDFSDHVFGVCLLNDWSARDIQGWEYVPLGPFLGKSFATSVSAWITPLDALAEAWVHAGSRNPRPLPYLDDSPVPSGLDLALEVRLNGTVVSRPPFASMYWTPPQMLAHITVNGARLRTGDLFASGTVSGAAPDERGCLLELSWNGSQPVTLADGTERSFLHDGDEVTITATARSPGGRIGLGEVRGRVRAGKSGTVHSVDDE